MKIMRPSAEYADSFAEALQEFEVAGIGGFWLAGNVLKERGIDAYMHWTQNWEKGIDLPEGWVPNSTFWLIDGGEFIAHGNIRHMLNDWLEKRGGHIGYSVRPSEHRKGYGTEFLRLLILEAQAIGIESALVTCSKENEGSRKIIERNGGAFHDEIRVENEDILRYFIDL